MRKSLLFFILVLPALCACGTHRTAGPAPAEKEKPDSRIITTQEQLDSLLALAEARVAREPSPEAFAERLTLYAAGEQWEKALQDAQTALTLLPPGDTGALAMRFHFAKADYSGKLGRAVESEAEYRWIEEHGNADEAQEARETLARMYLVQERYQHALAALRGALSPEGEALKQTAEEALQEAYEDSVSRITGIAPGSPYWYDPSWDISYSAARDTLYYYPRDRKAPHFSIPSSVRVIDERAFQCNKYLTEITVPASVNEIGVGAFLWSQALTSVTIQGAVTSLQWRTFDDCPKLKRVDLPASLSSLEGMTFCNCTRLESITVRAQEPPSVTAATADGEEDPMWDFYGVDKTRCILYVPKGCAAKYREAEGWNLFRNIREL